VTDSEDSGTLSASTALVEACRNRDIGMADLLLRHSARDDDCKALCLATRNRDDILTAKLLSIKVSNQLCHYVCWHPKASEELAAMKNPATVLCTALPALYGPEMLFVDK
jgi:ankyrin repeat protein